MRRLAIVVAVLPWGAGALSACGDDTITLPYQDGGLRDSTTTFEAATPFDAAGDVTTAEAGDAAAAPPSRLLLSFNGSIKSELVAFGVASKAVDGRLTYDDYLGTAYVSGGTPWLLEQSTDVVARLDALKPWIVDASWNVAMNDLTDAGDAQGYSDPQAVVVAGAKGYVLRFTRNLIGIIDPTKTVDAGPPSASIDLSGEVQAAGDGYAQPVAGAYAAAEKRVYVLLANINRLDVTSNGYVLLCANTTATVVAIDTTSDTLVDLNGAAPGHGWALGGYNPFGAGSLVYDAKTGSKGRLLILHSGCNQPGADGGVGPMVKREVEMLDLSTGQAQMLLDLTAAPFPQSLTYIDAHHAVVQTDTAYAWDPTTTTLGAAIPNAPDAFAYDGAGNLLGVKASYGTDGGLTGYDVVSVSLAGGTATKLGTDPFSLPSGFVGGVSLWPAP
jgi:hypothetical protein